MGKSEKDVALNGGFWTGVSTAVTMLATTARVMILTRFLEKSDFGLVSITNMVIALCATFTDLGFASVIMYKQKFTDREFGSLYWIQFILFIIIYAVILVLSPFIANFYKEPVLSTILPIASLSILFQAVGKLFDSVLQKQYRFKLLAFRNIISNLASLIIAVVLAWMGYGVYSLVFSTLSQVIIINIWNFANGVKIQRPKFIIDVRKTIPLVKIGVYQTGTRILDFFSGKLDVMIIGKLLGTETLGVYDLAKELVFKLVDFVRSVVSKVALPILSNSNSDDASVRNKFLLITKTVAFMCIPISITAAVFSEDIVHILYGENFLDTAPLVAIFAIITLFTSISSFFDMLGIAKGRTDLNFWNTVARILITTPVIFITSHYSVKMVALGQLLATLVMVVLFWNIVVKNTYPIPIKKYIGQFDRVFVVLLTIGGGIYVMRDVLSIQFENWILDMFVYLLIYILLLLFATRIFLMKDARFFINLLKRNK